MEQEQVFNAQTAAGLILKAMKDINEAIGYLMDIRKTYNDKSHDEQIEELFAAYKSLSKAIHEILDEDETASNDMSDKITEG